MFDLGLKECFSKLLLRKGEEKFELRHYFRLPSFDDWYEYHKKRNFMGLSRGKDTFEFSNVMQEEDLAFWESLIVRVEGYKAGDSDLMVAINWKEKVPVQHKLESLTTFLAFAREEEPSSALVTSEDGFDVDAETSCELKFSVIQNGEEYFVTHFFKTPETSDYVKFNRITSRLQLVRTKQKGVQEMRQPADIRPFVEMYDKLIVKVDGYTFDGVDVMDVADWKTKIDSNHKKEAVRELFTSPLLGEESEGNL